MSQPTVRPATTVTTRRGAQSEKVQTRGMRKELERKDDLKLQQQGIRKPNAALLEAKRKAKQQLLAGGVSSGSDSHQLKDIYQRAMDTLRVVRGETGLVFDNRMAEHKCLWDSEFPERPERFTRVMERCSALNLVDRCKNIASRPGTVDEVLLKHTQEHFDILKSTSLSEDEERLEDLSSQYDAIYLHPSTFELSLLAVGSTIELLDHILDGRCQNGMAVIRPPGHHAMKAEFNGYCFFNNVAVAAQRALDNGSAKRILIVDWDIHHGQATQRAFYDDPRVVYVSIHRYEHGTFWPNLRESDYDHIGEGDGLGYNFNLPLNAIKMTNCDYLAIWQQLLMPVAVEFQPDLVIVSAGYDAAYGCPEFEPDLVIVSAGYDSALGDEKGEMEITPACYAHLLAPLMTLASGRVAVILEGGYCLQSLAEGASLTLRTLLGDPCPLLVEPVASPCDSMRETILNCLHAHRPYWKSLQTIGTYNLAELNNVVNPQSDLHTVVQSYDWSEPLPERFPTRGCYPTHSEDKKITIAARLTQLENDTDLNVPPIRVSFVYDELMLEHRNLYEDHPERPERISTIEARFRDYNLIERLHRLPTRAATTDELCTTHTRLHISRMRKTCEPANDLQAAGDEYNSVYLHPKTFECAAVAVGSVLQVVDHVVRGKSRSGVCVVRPPGHHAEADGPQGFCIFNNVAVAAQYAVRDHGLKRVLILDWDVHHGNGTQHMFAESSEVLYVSVHRYDHGAFFPKSVDADFGVVGSGEGEGFNVNIPWNKKGMGDLEYALAMQRIVMPIAYEFDPQLVLVSAGFDAAIGDPLGGCKVTPEAFGHFTAWLTSLAAGRVVVCLEGGYNVNSVAYAMTMCTKALLGDPMPPIQTHGKAPNASCVETIQNVLSVQQKYWKSLRFNWRVPATAGGAAAVQEDVLSKAFSGIRLSGDKGEENTAGGQEDDEEAGAAGFTQPKAMGLKVSDLADGLDVEEMYAVYPLTDCPHLKTLNNDAVIYEINTKETCNDCKAANENWLCLHCYNVFCGRYINGHMIEHNEAQPEHVLALSFADLSVWCYGCESYVDNARLYEYKNRAHRDKFGVDMIWSYDGVPVGATLNLA